MTAQTSLYVVPTHPPKGLLTEALGSDYYVPSFDSLLSSPDCHSDSEDLFSSSCLSWPNLPSSNCTPSPPQATPRQMAYFSFYQETQPNSRQMLQGADFDRDLSATIYQEPLFQNNFETFSPRPFLTEDMYQPYSTGTPHCPPPSAMTPQAMLNNQYPNQRQWGMPPQPQRLYGLQHRVPDGRRPPNHNGYCPPNPMPTLTSPMPMNHPMISTPTASPLSSVAIMSPGMQSAASFSPVPTPVDDRHPAQGSPASSHAMSNSSSSNLALVQASASSSSHSAYRRQQELWKAVQRIATESNFGPFVPQLIYKPHTNSDRKRYVEEIDLSAPLYFTVEHPSEHGLLLTDALHSKTKRLAQRDQPLFEGRGPSISIRLEWPGYRPWTRQIPTKDFRSPPRPITMAKLAKNIAKCVQRFIEENKDRNLEEGSDRRWKIGGRYNEIKFEDIVLVSLHHVSLGSWQPQLRLRRPRHQ